MMKKAPSFYERPCDALFQCIGGLGVWVHWSVFVSLPLITEFLWFWQFRTNKKGC